jgi:hypothetical protein
MHGSVSACVKKTRKRHAVRKMKVGPSEPLCRGRLQTAIGCYGPMAAVVNAMVKRRDVDRVMWGSERRAKANLWVKHRNRSMLASKPRYTLCLGNSRAGTYLLVLWCPVQSRRESDPGFRTELENLVGSAKGKGTSGRAARPKVPMGQPGADCSVVLMRRRNFRGRKGAGHPHQDQQGQRATGGTRGS